ncbi:hypothetical protein [Bacteriophage sp.]|nr:hypothetical protein [Bacteriophage sp.]
MNDWIEPSKQDWIKDAPDSRIYGTREEMEARITSMLAAWRYAELNRAPTVAVILARYCGMTIAHWGLALMELNEDSQDV